MYFKTLITSLQNYRKRFTTLLKSPKGKRTLRFIRRYNISIVMMLAALLIAPLSKDNKDAINTFANIVAFGNIAYLVYTIYSIKRQRKMRERRITDTLDGINTRLTVLSKENIKWRGRAEAYGEKLKDLGFQLPE